MWTTSGSCTLPDDVERALRRLLESRVRFDYAVVKQLAAPASPEIPALELPGEVDLVRQAAYGRCAMTTDTYAPSAVGERIRELCRQFRLPTLAAETVGRFSDAGHADALPTLMEVLEQEAEDRRIRRVDRLRRASKLPAGKTWDTFEHERAPVKLRQQLVRLAEGDFVDRGVNVLAFGMPGTGKTHAMCAIGHRLVQAGRSVLFIPAYRLVQDMLAAKRDLDLPRMLRKLDNYDLLVIDDLGYLPQGAGESEVLFTLIAERYERRSLGITSNLVFSEWEKVFANPGDSRRDRQDRASLGHTRVRRAQLPDCRGAEPAGGGCVAPAKVIVARQKWLSRQLTSCRTYAVRNQQSEKESKRQNLLTHPAWMLLYMSATLSSIWLGFWMAE